MDQATADLHQMVLEGSRSPPPGGAIGGGVFTTPVKRAVIQTPVVTPAGSPTPSPPEGTQKFILVPRLTTTTTTTTTTKGDGMPATQQVTISAPLKFSAGRGTLRSRPLSRDNSKEVLQTAGALASFGGMHDSLGASTSTASLTTTSIYQQPHPPGTSSSPGTHATLISTTTSYLVDDATKLPSVSQSTHSPSLTASLIASANASKDGSPQQLNLPSIVSAHHARIAQLEATTCSQSESILELRQIVRNLQRQLVMVMASVPSTSGTGGILLSNAPPSVHRSRSNTELRYARAQKRLSGGSTSRTPTDGLVSQLHHGPHTSSMESLPGSNAHVARIAQSHSRPTSRYSSPRNQPAAKSSHHFSFHPASGPPQMSMQPPPGQIAVEPVQAIGTRTPGGRSRRFINAQDTPTTPQQQQPYQYPTSAQLPSRRLTPVEAFSLGVHLGHEEPAHAVVTLGGPSFSSPSSHPPAASVPAYPFQQVHLHFGSPDASPTPAPIQSLDNIRPLPLQHTVTHSKHGVTEYVLTFRDGEEVADHSFHYGSSADHNGYPGPSPRSIAFEQWKASQPGAVVKKEKKTRDKDGKKEKKTSRRDKEHTLDGDTSSPHIQTRALDDGGSEERKAKKAAKAESKKPCRVAGCGEARIGLEKYCKAHGGPAPINPNARKMMFQH